MASPQLSNGYMQIAHELLDKIIEYPFKGYELRIILKIARDTYGWKVKKKQISFGNISKRTGIGRTNVIHTTNILIFRKIIFKQKLNNNKNLWGVNKDYEEWLMPDGSNFQDYEYKEAATNKKSIWRSIWTTNFFPPIVEILEQEIGKLIKTYGEVKFIDALKISVKQNNKKLAYVEGILKRQESGEGDVTNKTKISDGKWLTDEELAKAEMEGKIYYENETNKWLTKPK